MLIPKTWLEKFVNLKGISDREFSEKMTFAGNKVESVQGKGESTVFELEITSNRPDTLSIIGLAREAAAIFGLQLKLPREPKITFPDTWPIKLLIKDKKLCPAYSLVEINNVSVQLSKSSMQNFLNLSGIRPVNNIVDITNYLMHETGQPMHAFDTDQIKDNLVLRAARANEKITPLDHVARILHGGEIIIEDKEKLIDLAGLMGGLNTEISDKTKRILLLMPIYDPVAIRRASQYLHLRTEASTRFEKELDLTQTELAITRALDLIIKESGGQPATRIFTQTAEWKPPIIPLDEANVTKRLGEKIEQKSINNLLGKIGILQTDKGFQIPPWRRDLTEPVDLMEEVARLYGYNNIKKTLPDGFIPTNIDALKVNFRRYVTNTFVNIGYTEIYTSTMIGKTLIEKAGLDPKDHLRVLHPMSIDYEYMRRTIFESLIPVIESNLKNVNSFDIFEFGSVFYPSNEKELPQQPAEIAVVSVGKNYQNIKGVMETLSNKIDLDLTVSSNKPDLNFLHPFIQATIINNNKAVGAIGQLNPKIINNQNPIFIFLLNYDLLMPDIQLTNSYPKQLKHQSIIEEVTLSVPVNTPIGPIIQKIKKSSKLIFAVDLDKIWEQKATFKIEFNSEDHQLTQEEVNREKEKIMKPLR